MTVKTLKRFFEKFLLTLTDHKFIFVSCKSVSVMTENTSFLLPPKIIWLAVCLQTICYMTSMQQYLKNFFSKLMDIFVLLVPLEILSYYPDIDICHWLR